MPRQSFYKFIKEVINNYDPDDDKIFIHCRGGHGRAGLFTATLLIMLYNYTAKRALETVYNAHQNRKEMSDKMRKLGSPQTKKQKEFVKDFETYKREMET